VRKEDVRVRNPDLLRRYCTKSGGASQAVSREKWEKSNGLLAAAWGV
jgi:hypothetical protein